MRSCWPPHAQFLATTFHHYFIEIIIKIAGGFISDANLVKITPKPLRFNFFCSLAAMDLLFQPCATPLMAFNVRRVGEQQIRLCCARTRLPPRATQIWLGTDWIYFIHTILLPPLRISSYHFLFSYPFYCVCGLPLTHIWTLYEPVLIQLFYARATSSNLFSSFFFCSSPYARLWPCNSASSHASHYKKPFFLFFFSSSVRVCLWFHKLALIRLLYTRAALTILFLSLFPYLLLVSTFGFVF